MPNGKPGDHPLTDILAHRLQVYSPAIDELIREIAVLSDERGRRELGDMLFFEYSDFSNPDLAKLKDLLTRLLAQRRHDASMRGWEP